MLSSAEAISCQSRFVPQRLFKYVTASMGSQLWPLFRCSLMKSTHKICLLSIFYCPLLSDNKVESVNVTGNKKGTFEAFENSFNRNTDCFARDLHVSLPLELREIVNWYPNYLGRGSEALEFLSQLMVSCSSIPFKWTWRDSNSRNPGSQWTYTGNCPVMPIALIFVV